jgi:hypothetical protein
MSTRSMSSMLRHCSSVSNQHASKKLLRHSSSSSKTLNIPPESPQFIHIPRSPQQSSIVIPQMKGTLPVPRLPMKIKEKDQLRVHYETTTPEPVFENKAAENAPTEEARKLINWKIQASALRRKNFREGFTDLRNREANTQHARKKATEYKQAQNKRRLEAPEPAAEFLSRPTVLSYMKNSSNLQKQLERQAKASFSQRKQRYQQLQSAKQEEKRTNVHALYVNAKDFIVNHEQLDKRITEVFDSPFYQHNPEMGVWDEFGFPETTDYLLGRSGRASSKLAISAQSAHQETTRDRLEEIAEELTGGRLSS